MVFIGTVVSVDTGAGVIIGSLLGLWTGSIVLLGTNGSEIMDRGVMLMATGSVIKDRLGVQGALFAAKARGLVGQFNGMGKVRASMLYFALKLERKAE